MKTPVAAFSVVVTALLPMLANAHAGHGPEAGIAHELIHAQWLLVGLGCLAVIALARRSRPRTGTDDPARTPAEPRRR